MAERTSQATSRRLNDCGGYFDRIQRAETVGGKIELAAHWLLQAFDDYYIESRGIPDLAKSAFERRDPGESLAISKRRLSIYSESIHTLGLSIVGAFPQLGESEQLWRKVEETYSPRIHEHRATAIVAAVENLKNGPLDPLLDLLSRPAGNDIVELEASRHTVG